MRRTTRAAQDRRLVEVSGQTYLPIFDTIVFFDWYGTLSTSRFWEDITEARRHALKGVLGARLRQLFSVEKETISLWMLGELTDADVVDKLDVPLPRHYKQDYLCRALYRGCAASLVHPGMAKLVRELRSRTLIAVATDNMACFLTAPPAVLSAEAPVDTILSSTERRTLKLDDPLRFFAPALQAAGLEFADAVLIDDCPRTCAAFRSSGGRAYHFQGFTQLLRELRSDPSRAVRDAARRAPSRPSEGFLQLSLFADDPSSLRSTSGEQL